MSSYDQILVVSGETVIKLTALAASTSSTEQLLGVHQIFAINATGDCHIKFGETGMAAAAATDFRIPANSTMVFDTGSQYTFIRIFNPTASTIDVYIKTFARS